MKGRLRVAVIGANGRMGQEISKLLAESKAFEPTVGVVRNGQAQGFLQSTTSLSSPALRKAEVWIDFSGVESFESVLNAAVKTKKPLVSGVTGLSVFQKSKMSKAAGAIPVLWSANMSLGVAALKKALAIAKDLQGFDFQVEEVHHRLKKDRPSGTAIALHEVLSKHTDQSLPEPVSIRGGGVFGIHRVWMMSNEEVLTFEHQALNRAVFAKGALRAAQWIKSQHKGLYSMEHLLKDSE